MPRPSPEVKQEKFDIPEIPGGAVYVRAIPLSERFRINALNDSDKISCETLAVSVVDETGEPIWTFKDWDVFGGQHNVRFNELLAHSFRLADMKGDEAKKPEGQS